MKSHKFKDAVKDSTFCVFLGVDSELKQLQRKWGNHCAHWFGEQVSSRSFMRPGSAQRCVSTVSSVWLSISGFLLDGIGLGGGACISGQALGSRGRIEAGSCVGAAFDASGSGIIALVGAPLLMLALPS